MKKLLIIACLSLLGLTTFAQNVDLRHKIEVTGIAEQEVTPDIINVSISLQEYKDGRDKVTIDQLENQLETAVKRAGIPKEDFTVNNVLVWNNVWQKKKNPDFLASKQYLVRLHDLNKFNQILAAVDPKGIQSTSIESYDYSKMPELKRELKIQALLAAKEKATYLLSSIGEKLGRPIDITETDNSNYPMANQVFANRMTFKSTQAGDSDIDFKKIKLSFQVQVIFEIAP
ncbi:MAG TPA: SIMPL domain-containing protein [Mucilaginibacter sp.]|nr:SIMPL domain-containing protein [Mucilaginibacter sp.]